MPSFDSPGELEDYLGHVVSHGGRHSDNLRLDGAADFEHRNIEHNGYSGSRGHRVMVKDDLVGFIGFSRF